ncbi:SDR family oxidoreductase [Rhodococcus sp. NPDC058521]|uniref:SDR family oxidoreductase n=1 Tax=Rhodococcus sp. NPDC058521 TaxID=3346536 RepID=UPI003664EAD1
MISQLIARAALEPLPSVNGVASRILRSGHGIEGKTVLITGASSGVGEAAARRLAELGAGVVLVARGSDRLERVRDEILRSGSDVWSIPCDLTDPNSVRDLAGHIRSEVGAVDVLINNAGRSIRRPVTESLDRFHDLERTMAINYFGSARLIHTLLPAMLERRYGHIINVATWGVRAGAMPKFAAYHASKSAISAFGRDLGAELHDTGVHVSTVHFPLVRTPMIAPTTDYDSMTALTPEQAAEWFVTAIRTRPVELMPSYTELLRVIDLFAPTLTNRLVRRAGI